MKGGDFVDGTGESAAGLRLGRRRLPPLSVPGELFELYQPIIGTDAVMAWLNLRWLIHAGGNMQDLESVLRYRFGMHQPTIGAALEKLIEYELLEGDAHTGYIVHEPLSSDAFFPRFSGEATPEVEQPPLPAFTAEDDGPPARSPGADVSVTPPQPPPADEAPARSGGAARRPVAVMPPPATLDLGEASGVDEQSAQATDAAQAAANDLSAVIQMYHKKIGMIGSVQMEKLRFWVEEQKMEAEVVALAIEETVASAKNPRINYLEGILKNWYNSGIRTLADLMQDEYASRVLHPRDDSRGGRRSREGAPNATAYQSVNPELIDRWKEMYPDEYE